MTNTLILIIFILFLLPIVSNNLTIEQSSPAAQAPESLNINRVYIESEERQRFDFLMENYGPNKELPEGYELQTLLALSHFPELSDVHIRFIQDDVSIPISSRPFWTSMLKSASRRTYLVVIDTDMEGDRAALLVKNQPFNAQIGIIGHELAHTVYYLNRSFFGIMSDALCQLSDCRIDFEQDTDRRLIDYGLGWQRYEHSSFVRKGFDALGLGGGNVYYGPTQLLDLIQDHPAYAETLSPE